MDQGLEAQRVSREARLVFNYPLRDVWPTLHIEVYEFPDSVGTIRPAVDPVRLVEEGNKEAGTIYLWIGEVPRSLSFEDVYASQYFPRTDSSVSTIA